MMENGKKENTMEKESSSIQMVQNIKASGTMVCQMEKEL